MKKFIAFILLMASTSVFATSGHYFFTHFTRLHFPKQAEMRMCTTMVTKDVAKVEAVVAIRMVRAFDYEYVFYTNEQVVELKDMGDHFFGTAIQKGAAHSHSHDQYDGPVVTYRVTFKDGDQTEIGPEDIEVNYADDDASIEWLTQDLESVEDAYSTFALTHYYGYAS